MLFPAAIQRKYHFAVAQRTFSHFAIQRWTIVFHSMDFQQGFVHGLCAFTACNICWFGFAFIWKKISEPWIKKNISLNDQSVRTYKVWAQCCHLQYLAALRAFGQQWARLPIVSIQLIRAARIRPTAKWTMVLRIRVQWVGIRIFARYIIHRLANICINHIRTKLFAYKKILFHRKKNSFIKK